MNSTNVISVSAMMAKNVAMVMDVLIIAISGLM
jgi:hypothetical protein